MEDEATHGGEALLDVRRGISALHDRALPSEMKRDGISRLVDFEYYYLLYFTLSPIEGYDILFNPPQKMSDGRWVGHVT